MNEYDGARLPDLSVLLVEDDEIMRMSLEDRLRMEGIPTVSSADLAGARRELSRRRVDLVVTDVRLPDGSGRTLFEEVCRDFPGMPVILITAYVSVPEAVRLIKAGAVDYLTKPFDIEAFVSRVTRTLSNLSSARQAAELTAADGGKFRAGSGVLGKSPSMRRIEELVARLRDVDSAVLLVGESGVGKEVVAHLIHNNSRRATGPFVAVNCAAIPATLVESELLGHERGAFTGADRRHVGHFEQAQRGTIFLDEVAEVPPETQVKLLRVLQERSVQRVGGTAPVELDVRVLAAMQTDPAQAMKEGRLRSDLYWRLNVFQIAIPPLHTRPEDILYLAHVFVAEHTRIMDKEVGGLSPEAEAHLLKMPWPGNVRELKNMLERAVALCASPQIEVHDLVPFGGGDDVTESASAPTASLRTAVEKAEQSAIRSALARSGGAIAEAAGALGISRKNLWEKMRRYGIER